MAGAFTLAMGAAGVLANEPGYGQGGERRIWKPWPRDEEGMGMMHSAAQAI